TNFIGTNVVHYDLFAATSIGLSDSIVSAQWSWFGQGFSCRNYRLDGQPDVACWYVLGEPTDSDGDWLSNAYELLVSKSSPTSGDTDGDGVNDGVELLQGRNIRIPGIVSDTNNLIHLEVYTPLK